MKLYYYLPLFCLFIFTMANCNGQVKKQNETTNNVKSKLIVGGGCDGCELMYVGMPKNIEAVDTSSGWYDKGQKLLITGVVYKLDGKTPASDVIIYYWQTDNNGYYSPKPGMEAQSKRHGHIRGWVKTDQNGNYSIYTIRPAPYPNNTMPAHIHTSLKEPNVKDEYYIDEFVFDDDQLLTENKREALENRGGSGIIKLSAVDDIQVGKHNIILGLNIPNY